MEKQHTTVNVSTVTVLKVLAVILLVWFLFAIRDILLLFIIAIIISSAMDPLADYLRRIKIPRGLSVLFVYALALGLLALVVYLMVPPISDQFQQISQSNFYEGFRSKIGEYQNTLDHFGIGTSLENNIRELTSGITGTLFNTTKGVLSGLVSTLTVLVLSFYLTTDENGMKNFIKHLTPYRHQAYVMKLVNKIQRKMGAWVLGQVILSIVIFGLTFIGLTLLGVEYALVLALIAGVLEIIPIIGPIISAVPALFFAFIQNPPLALAVLILYIVVQQVENHVLVPVVMSKSVGLNPVLVILGILVGGALGGIVGAVIAVPVLAGISVFVSDMLEQEEAVA